MADLAREATYLFVSSHELMVARFPSPLIFTQYQGHHDPGDWRVNFSAIKGRFFDTTSFTLVQLTIFDDVWLIESVNLKEKGRRTQIPF